MGSRGHWMIVGVCALVSMLFGVGIGLAQNNQDQPEPPAIPEQVIDQKIKIDELETPPAPPQPVITHLDTPKTVKALYMSAWVASAPSLREKIIKLADDSEINAIVIDIKDATGRVSFMPNDQLVTDTGSPRELIKNISDFINTLHAKHIYVIGRIAVFQDPFLTKEQPDWSIKSKSTGAIWKDRKGLSFLDPTNTHVWDYTVHLAQASYDAGFDEINFDYVRFPSDGNISDIAYPATDGTKADAMERFYAHLDTELRQKQHIPISADLFGMTTSNTDDLGIGQVLEKALPHFDYIAPMVYPSHYPKNFNGYANPAAHPYEVIKFAMSKGVARATAIGLTAHNFRPWIQDFNLGATYTASMVRDQIRALNEQGIDSYMVWDPANTYTEDAFLKE